MPNNKLNVKRTVDIPKAFKRAFDLTGIKKTDFGKLMNRDSGNVWSLTTQKPNVTTDILTHSAHCFGMSVSEFVMLGEKSSTDADCTLGKALLKVTFLEAQLKQYKIALCRAIKRPAGDVPAYVIENDLEH